MRYMYRYVDMICIYITSFAIWKKIRGCPIREVRVVADIVVKDPMATMTAAHFEITKVFFISIKLTCKPAC